MGVELLAIRIRQSNNVKGLNLDIGKILQILLYADDITVFLQSREDVENILIIIEEFSVFSGLRLNKQKSEAMGIGTNRNVNFGFGLRWVDQIKVLGIYFSSKMCASEIDRNWTDRIIKRLPFIAPPN